MSYSLKNTAGSVVLLLKDTDGEPALGLDYSDVFVDIRKAGGTFASKVLAAPDFVDLGLGNYELALTAEDTNTLGDLLIFVSSTLADNYITAVRIVATAPASTPGQPAVDTSYVYGYLKDLEGDPIADTSVVFRILYTPTILGVGVGVSNNSIIVKSASDGFFYANLISGAYVDVLVSELNFRRSLTIPYAPVNLFSEASPPPADFSGSGGSGTDTDVVTSVFGRIGAIVPVAGDYLASQVTNDSELVAGTYVSEALDALATAIGAVDGGGDVTSVFGRTGDVAPVAGDYVASEVLNDSTLVTGTYVSAALDTLAAEKAPLASPTFTGTVTASSFAGALTGNASTTTAALGLKTATTTVSVSGATAPSTGQVLTATSSTAATWQSPSGGSSTVDGGSVGFPIALNKKQVRTCHHTIEETAEDTFDSAGVATFPTTTGRRYAFRALLSAAFTDGSGHMIVHEYLVLVKNVAGTASLAGTVQKLHGYGSGASAYGEGGISLEVSGFSGSTFKFRVSSAADILLDAVLTLEWNEQQL